MDEYTNENTAFISIVEICHDVRNQYNENGKSKEVHIIGLLGCSDDKE